MCIDTYCIAYNQDFIFTKEQLPLVIMLLALVGNTNY